MWPFKPKIEQRNYTDSIVAAALAGAEGQGAADARLTAAAATAGSLWARSFGAGEVSPGIPETGLTADNLYQIGLDLCLWGESCWAIGIEGSRVTLTKASSWLVTGKEQWRYRLDLSQPDGVVQRNVSSDAVFHPRINTPSNQPWRGRSPFSMAGHSARMLGGLERAMADEANSPSGYLLPLPLSDSSQEAVERLTEKLRLARGRTRVVASAVRGWEDAPPTSPSGDYQPRRIGSNPPESLVILREQAVNDILSACGIPPSMFAVGGQASGAREAFRQYVFSTLMPIAKTVIAEAQAKLHPNTELSFKNLSASDLQGRARSFKSLVDGGMSLSDAASNSGFLINEDE